MDYRRLQHSYPPRPSPLGVSQEPRTDQPRQFAAPFSPHEPRGQPESDKPRPCPSPSSNTTPSPSQLFQTTTSRTSHASLRGDAPSAYFPSRNGPAQAHRRHGSLETRNHEQTHRRNNSQPQAVRYREGTQTLVEYCFCFLIFLCVYFPRVAWFRCPRLQIPRIGLVPWLAASTLLQCGHPVCATGRNMCIWKFPIHLTKAMRPVQSIPRNPFFPCPCTLPLMDFPQWRRSTGRQLGSASPH